MQNCGSEFIKRQTGNKHTLKGTEHAVKKVQC